MTKKQAISLLRRHTLEGSLSYRLFDKDSESNRPCPELSSLKGEIWNLDDDSMSYKWFLDNVRSLGDLIQGLEELEPFADDALQVARQMTGSDFSDFRMGLACERRGECSGLPEWFRTILMPDRIFKAMILAEKAHVPLGVALVRIFEVENNIEGG